MGVEILRIGLFICIMFYNLPLSNITTNTYNSDYTSKPIEISDVVTATVYHAVKRQCNNDNLTTANGSKINPNNPFAHRFLAVFPYGTRVLISGTDHYDGEWIVSDTMNKRFKKRIDFLINEDMPIGKWHNVYIKAI